MFTNRKYGPHFYIINGILLLGLTLKFNWSRIEPMEIAEIQPEVSYCIVRRQTGMPGVLITGYCYNFDHVTKENRHKTLLNISPLATDFVSC